MLEKLFYTICLVLIYAGFYVCSELAFAQRIDIIAWPMVIGGAMVIFAITLAYINYYWGYFNDIIES